MTRHRFIRILLAAAILAISSAAFAAQTAAAVAAAQSAPSSHPAIGKTMIFRFEDARVEDVLREVSMRLGIVIEKDGVIPGRISIMVPQPLNEDDAVELLNSILLSVKYAAIEVHRQGDDRRILRVMSFERAKKEAPVEEGLPNGE